MSVVKNYTLYNLTLSSAGTEFSQVITDHRCYVRIHAVDLMTTARVTFTSGQTATAEIIFQGAEWFTPAPLASGVKTIYLETPNAGAVYQIIVWEIE